jgi:RNA polymerase sigma-70 factor (ECF subfamily)
MALQSTPLPLELPGDDADLVRRIAARDQAAFETMMRRHNGSLFRVARTILRDDAEAEDALQDAYLDAYRHMAEFRGGAKLLTWLTRIVINHSLMRLRKQRRERVVVPFGWAGAGEPDQAEADVADTRTESPSSTALRAELRRALERRIDELPVAFRTVFVMREVEELTVDEVADLLAIPPATVRTRLFRARALLREALAREIDHATIDVFSFAGARCDRIVAATLARAAALPADSDTASSPGAPAPRPASN